MNGLPSVAIVIPSWNGVAHLPDCLDSIEELDYPRDRIEVVVVDNGSTDGSSALIEESYPQVHVVALDENRGFAEACNEGARRATSECVALLNNDMRVEPGWLRGLVAGYEPDAGYVCVAGVILDWDGERIDFAGGWVNFHAAAGNEHFHAPLNEALIEDGRDLPFACGGSMLIAQDVFLELGGFDPAYFAFYEDVDLGWRLWLAGYKVRLSGASRCFHRHHSTGASIPSDRQMLLLERNALWTLIKNVDDENLAPLVASALFLVVMRGVLASPSPRFDAVAEVVADLPQLLERRSDVQRRRKRSDTEIFDLFGRPFAPLLETEPYVEASVAVRTLFGLDRLFTRQRATRVLVVGSGDSARLPEMARFLSDLSDVAVLAPGRSADVLEELLTESDLVLVGATTPHARTIAEKTAGLLVVDLADGTDVESPELRQRADVLLSPEDGLQALRDLVREPWRRRRGTAEVPVPEDLQQLLRHRRERRAANRPAGRFARAMSRAIPTRFEDSVRRLVGRSRLTA